MYDLSRFLKAQEHSYQNALNEMKAGRKRSHWIWYIFPQLRELGKSKTAVYYGIENLDDAKEYLADETLRGRLLEISQALLELENNNSVEVMNSRIDSVKLQSSMTLFHLAEPTCEVFKKVIDKFFAGQLDAKTVELCNVAEQN